MGRTALVFALLRKVALEIPLLFLLNHFFPLYGLPWAQVSTEMVLASAAIVMLVRIFNQKPNDVDHTTG
jgi:Na+-driven multidrug efflux pump